MIKEPKKSTDRIKPLEHSLLLRAVLQDAHFVIGGTKEFDIYQSQFLKKEYREL